MLLFCFVFFGCYNYRVQNLSIIILTLTLSLTVDLQSSDDNLKTLQNELEALIDSRTSLQKEFSEQAHVDNQTKHDLEMSLTKKNEECMEISQRMHSLENERDSLEVEIQSILCSSFGTA